jgi:hypothetical protein
LTIPDLRVFEEDGVYYLKSTEFDGLPGEDEVYAHAKDRMPVLNGIASVHMDGYRNVGVSGGGSSPSMRAGSVGGASMRPSLRGSA